MKLKLLAILFFLVSSLNAQLMLPRTSPAASVYQNIGYTTISIDYCRPAVKERVIWGDLVPYGKAWRTGANENTRIRFTTDVIVEGRNVEAGMYSIYTIPNEKEWTIIFNKALVWGLDYYPEEDLFRFNVKPEKGEFTERLLFTMNEITDSSCRVDMSWEKLKISFHVNVKLNDQVYRKIKEAISKAKPDEYQVYIAGAEYAADNNVFINEAFEWINKALTISKNFNCYLTKAKLFYSQGKYHEALREIDKCRDAGRNDSDYLNHIANVDFLEKRIKSKL